MKNVAHPPPPKPRSGKRCALWFGLFVLVAWFFRPTMVCLPFPPRQLMEAATGSLSDTAFGWLRWLAQISVLSAVAVSLVLWRRYVGPVVAKYHATRPVRMVLGEWFELQLLLTALGVGYLAILGVAAAMHLTKTPSADGVFGLRMALNHALLAVGPWGLVGLLVAYLVMDRGRFCRCLMPFIRVRDQGGFGGVGCGRFATALEEAALLPGRRELSLYVGRSLYSPFRDIFIGGERHMMTFGPSRCGKGAAVIIPAILRMDAWTSLLCLDPKGTAAAVTARFLQEQGKKVHLVMPYGDETACFNPLDDLDPNDLSIRKRINSIADALVIPTPNQRDPHWDRSALIVIAGLIAHILTTYENPTLPLIRILLCLPADQQQLLWQDMAENDGAGGLAREAAARILRSAGQAEMLAVLATVDTHTQWLSDPALARVLSKSDFLMSDLKREPTAIFVCLPVETIKTTRGFSRVFVNLQLAAMPRGGRSPIPILSIVDEAPALGKMEAIVDAYRMTANFNCTLWCFAQDLPGMACYGDDLKSMIACSRGVQVLGADDLETARYISDVLGQHQNGQRTVSLRSPDEVMRDLEVETRRQYLLRAGAPPLLLRKVPYYQDRRLKGKYDEDPNFVAAKA